MKITYLILALLLIFSSTVYAENESTEEISPQEITKEQEQNIAIDEQLQKNEEDKLPISDLENSEDIQILSENTEENGDFYEQQASEQKINIEVDAEEQEENDEQLIEANEEQKEGYFGQKKDGEVFEECYINDHCPSLHNCIANKCVHKPLLPLTGQEIVGLVGLLILVGLAQSGGIGGGPILMPILMGVFNYSTKQAIALSLILIFGGSCGNFLNNSSHKTQNQTPLIWYDLVLISLPLLLAGAIFGVAMNHFLPSSIITIVLIYILYNTLTKTYKKYKQMVEKEKLEKQQEAMGTPLVDAADLEGQFSNKISPELQKIYETERIQYPTQKYANMFVVLAIIVALSLLKGGKGVDSFVGIEPCGLMYWGVNFTIFFLCIYISKRFTQEMLNFEQTKIKLGFDFKKYGEIFDEEKAQATGKAAIFAGFIGGLLGLGGGVILTPKWLEMGIPSDRTAATATFTVCFTSFISFFANFLAGKYDMGEVLFFYVLSFIASFIVSRILRYFTDKYQKKSLVIGILLLVIGLALCLLPTFQIFTFLADPSKIYTFGNLC